MKDKLGERMKQYEIKSESFDTYIPRDIWMIVRLDGRNFSRKTKNVERPFSKTFHETMLDVTERLMEESGAVTGYTQSDEVSLLFAPVNPETQDDFFSRRKQKLVSILASIATAKFNNSLPESTGFKPYGEGHFDCRIITPIESEYDAGETEAVNYFIWRNQDAVRNCITSLARNYFSHKKIQGKNTTEMLEMLAQENVHWDGQIPEFRYGSFLKKQNYEIEEGVIRTRFRKRADKISFHRDKDYILCSKLED